MSFDPSTLSPQDQFLWQQLESRQTELRRDQEESAAQRAAFDEEQKNNAKATHTEQETIEQLTRELTPLDAERVRLEKEKSLADRFATEAGARVESSQMVALEQRKAAAEKEIERIEVAVEDTEGAKKMSDEKFKERLEKMERDRHEMEEELKREINTVESERRTKGMDRRAETLEREIHTLEQRHRATATKLSDPTRGAAGLHATGADTYAMRAFEALEDEIKAKKERLEEMQGGKDHEEGELLRTRHELEEMLETVKQWKEDIKKIEQYGTL